LIAAFRSDEAQQFPKSEAKMKFVAQATRWLGRFRRSRPGNILIMAALMAMVLTASVGIAVDYYRMVHFKNTLQGAVDAAAIAGAAVYVGPGNNAQGVAYATAGQNIALTYLNSAHLPSHVGSVIATATPSSSSAGYFMSVTAQATVPTTFLAIWTSSVSIAATATAENAIVNVQINAGGWNANAYDQNTVFYYLFDPSNNTLPNQSDMHPMFSNAPGYNNPSVINLQMSASQHLAFAFQNITGGNTAYGGNGYGGAQGSTHWFYSHYPRYPDTSHGHNYTTPNSAAYPNTVANAGHNGETYRPPSNCSLEITIGSSSMNSATAIPPNLPQNGFDAVHTNTCNDSTSNPNYANTQSYSAPTCADLNSVTTTTNQGVTTTHWNYKYAQFNWNDMGGGTDDYDYNDGVYYMSCPTPNNTPKVVTLIR
jgi:Flp pilus assembly protein TadG